jgi:hypothetical protein
MGPQEIGPQEMDADARVRARAFEFLAEQTGLRSEASPREVLRRGFDLDGVRVPLVGPQGIFKPAVLPELPLTITTVPPGVRPARAVRRHAGPGRGAALPLPGR